MTTCFTEALFLQSNKFVIQSWSQPSPAQSRSHLVHHVHRIQNIYPIDINSENVMETCSSRLVHLEPKNFGDIALHRLLWLEVPIGHQEQMRECGAEIRSINIYASEGNHRKWNMDFPQLMYLHKFKVWLVALWRLVQLYQHPVPQI